MFHFSGTKTTLETMFCYGGRFTGDGHSGSHGRNCNFVGCGDMLQRTTLAGKPLLLPVLFKLAATAETTAKTAATAMQAATRRLTLQAMFRTALTAMPPQQKLRNANIHPTVPLPNISECRRECGRQCPQQC